MRRWIYNIIREWTATYYYHAHYRGKYSIGQLILKRPLGKLGTLKHAYEMGMTDAIRAIQRDKKLGYTPDLQ